MLQTILIPKDKYSLAEAIFWLRSHNYPHPKVDITDKFYRFRQHTPEAHSKYYTMSLRNGIEMVHTYE